MASKGIVPGKKAAGGSNAQTGAAAGGRPKVGVKKPSGKTQPVMKGSIGKKKGASGKTALKVPSGKKGSSY